MEEKKLTHEEIDSRIELLTELLHCNGKMFISKYNSQGTLMTTNSSNMIFDTILRSSGLLDEALEFSKNSLKPLIVTSVIGMMWSIVYQQNDEEDAIFLHTMGPIFSNEFSEDSINRITKTKNIKESWKSKLIGYLKNVPTVSATDFFKYTLMLHRCVNNEYLKPSDITFSNNNHDDVLNNNRSEINYAEYWTRENNVMNIIKTGDIYYKTKMASASSIMQNFRPSSDKEFDEAKQFATVFSGLCIRAAIEGGISPDTAYLRGNVYLNNITSAKSFAEVMSICHAIFEDFLFLVHNNQTLPNYSDPIKSCISYIEAHTDEPLSIDYLASKIGYSNYYLSKKFKSEVGMSVNSYIKKARISKASYLLVSSKMDIQEISDFLHFGNRNFFTKVFKEEVGQNPATFRNNHKKRL